MLSYLHGYHAGNFADVHKHVVVLQKMQQKPMPLTYLETHAGSGFYSLVQPPFPTRSEWREGIAKLWSLPTMPPAIRHYCDQVVAVNGRHLSCYPGSPRLVAGQLRKGDTMVLMELHPQEAPALRTLFETDKRVVVHQQDGFTGLLALCPPRTPRGLILIDPSYEVKTDYQTVPPLVAQVKKRFAGAVIAIWYPLLPHEPHRVLLDGLREVGLKKVYRCEIRRTEPANLQGSGLVVVDLPWPLETELNDWGPWLAAQLDGKWLGEWWIGE